MVRNRMEKMEEMSKGGRGFPAKTIEEEAEEEAKKTASGYTDYLVRFVTLPKPLTFEPPAITLGRVDLGSLASKEVTALARGGRMFSEIFPVVRRAVGLEYRAPAYAGAVGAAPAPPEAETARYPTMEELVKWAQATIAVPAAPPAYLPTPPAEAPPMYAPPPMVPAAAPAPVPTPTPTVTAGPGPERPWVYQPTITPTPLPVERHVVPYAKEVPLAPERVKAGLISRPW